MKNKMDKVIDFILVLLVIGMTTVVSIAVFFRYVLNHPLSWTEEVTRLMIVWLSFMGAYMAMREKKHIGFDLFISKLPDMIKRGIELAGHILILIFLIVVVWEGFKFSQEFLNVGMPYTNIPVGWFAYSVFPVSGTLMLVQTVISIREIVKTRGKA
jgi:TRAP-type C4-dicarboxylate transport system permease small subunit